MVKMGSSWRDAAVDQEMVCGGTPDDDQWGDFDWTKPSFAVVANNPHGNGCVLWHVGAHIAYELEENGFIDLADLGLGDAPEGVSVWEGRYVAQAAATFITEYEYEYELVPEGKFREPTREEWVSIMSGKCPWNHAAWKIGYDSPNDENVSE